MFHFVSITLLLFFALPLLADIPPGGLAYPVEPLLRDSGPLKNITAEQLSKLPIDDPLLRHAYAELLASQLMLQIYARNRNIDYAAYPTWNVAALEDIKKRGDTVTPLLLDIAAKNPNSGFETGVLGNAPYVIKDLNPYLVYARNVLRTRTMEMDSSVAGTAAELLVKHGTPDDVEQLRSLVRIRPYLTGTIEGVLRHAAVFQAPRKTDSDPKTGITPLVVQPPSASKKAPGSNPGLTPSEEASSLIPWSMVVVLIMTATGVLWMLVKKQK